MAKLAQPPAGRAARPGQRRAPRLTVLTGVAAVLAAVLASCGYLPASHQNNSGGLLRPSGIPANISTSLANLMSLTPLPRDPAPGFTLTDQAGRKVSLASLRGKVVVLEFMDPHCTDICPLVSQEFVDAYHDLGPAAAKVEFTAINVNAYHRSEADVAAFSREHGLTSIPGWHFFTGSAAALAETWRAYHIDVQAPNPNADIQHTSAVYFLDTRGREAFLASPMVDHTKKGTAYLPPAQLAAWGRGIALVARHLAG